MFIACFKAFSHIYDAFNPISYAKFANSGFNSIVVLTCVNILRPPRFTRVRYPVAPSGITEKRIVDRNAAYRTYRTTKVSICLRSKFQKVSTVNLLVMEGV